LQNIPHKNYTSAPDKGGNDCFRIIKIVVAVVNSGRTLLGYDPVECGYRGYDGT
jgi:hypothetical protein